MRARLLVLALLVVLVAAPVWRALGANSSELVRVGGLGSVLFTTVAGAISADYQAQSHALTGRQSYVAACTVNGMPVVALVRVTHGPRGTFVDLVMDSDVANLSSRATALSITGQNHPASVRDAADTAALVAAGGS